MNLLHFEGNLSGFEEFNNPCNCLGPEFVGCQGCKIQEKAPEPDNKTVEKSTKSQNSDQVSQCTIIEVAQLIINTYILDCYWCLIKLTYILYIKANMSF